MSGPALTLSVFPILFGPVLSSVCRAAGDQTCEVLSGTASHSDEPSAISGIPQPEVNAAVRTAHGGQRVCIAAEDHSAKIWSAATGECLATLAGRGEKFIFEYAFFSTDCVLIFSGGTWHKRIWSAASGQCLRTHPDWRWQRMVERRSGCQLKHVCCALAQTGR